MAGKHGFEAFLVISSLALYRVFRTECEVVTKRALAKKMIAFGEDSQFRQLSRAKVFLVHTCSFLSQSIRYRVVCPVADSGTPFQ